MDQILDAINKYGLSWTLSTMLAVAFGVFLRKLIRNGGWIDQFVAKQTSLMGTLETSLVRMASTTSSQATDTKSINKLLEELQAATANDEAARRHQFAFWIEGLKQAAVEWGWPESLIKHLETAEAELLK